MFESPGTQMGDDLKRDVQDVKRWLARFVPELEQQLDNISTDNFTSAYNERVEGLRTLSGAPGSKTTADAVAEHLLDYNNPHRVNLSQLGYEVPQAVYTETDHGGNIRLGGLMLQWLDVSIAAGTGDLVYGNVYGRNVSLGNWDVEFGTLYGTWLQQRGSDGSGGWFGSNWGASKLSAGTVKNMRGEQSMPASSVRIYGIGTEA